MSLFNNILPICLSSTFTDVQNITSLNKEFYKIREEIWKVKLARDFPNDRYLSHISSYAQYFYYSPVFLRFYCEISGISETFIETSRWEAERFMNNLEYLENKVEILTLNSGDPEFPLSCVDIQICGKNKKGDRIIFERNSPFWVSGFFNPHYDSYVSLGKKCYLNPSKLHKEENLYLRGRRVENWKDQLEYKYENDLYQSVMLYCIYDLINMMKEKNKKVSFSKNIDVYKCIRLGDNKNNLITHLEIPSIKNVKIYSDGHIWLEPANPKDVNLIKMVNDLCDIFDNIRIEYLRFM